MNQAGDKLGPLRRRRLERAGLPAQPPGAQVLPEPVALVMILPGVLALLPIGFLVLALEGTLLSKAVAFLPACLMLAAAGCAIAWGFWKRRLWALFGFLVLAGLIAGVALLLLVVMLPGRPHGLMMGGAMLAALAFLVHRLTRPDFRAWFGLWGPPPGGKDRPRFTLVGR